MRQMTEPSRARDNYFRRADKLATGVWARFRLGPGHQLGAFMKTSCLP